MAKYITKRFIHLESWNRGLHGSSGNLPILPAHWHEAMEILFCLNGTVTIHIEHEPLSLSHNQLIVFDSKEVHSIHSYSNLYMFLCIHVDKKLSIYCPDFEFDRIPCRPIPLDNPKSTQYIHLCQLAHRLPVQMLTNGTPVLCVPTAQLY